MLRYLILSAMAAMPLQGWTAEAAGASKETVAADAKPNGPVWVVQAPSTAGTVSGPVWVVELVAPRAENRKPINS